MAELIRIFVVSLEIPVRRRRDNKMDTLIREEGKFPRVPVDKSMCSCFHRFYAHADRWPARTFAKRSTDRSSAGIVKMPLTPCLDLDVMKADAV